MNSRVPQEGRCALPAYPEKVGEEFQSEGNPAKPPTALGEPANEIIKWIQEKGRHPVAITTHDHRLVGHLFLGTIAPKAQHSSSVPVPVLRAK